MPPRTDLASERCPSGRSIRSRHGCSRSSRPPAADRSASATCVRGTSETRPHSPTSSRSRGCRSRSCTSHRPADCVCSSRPSSRLRKPCRWRAASGRTSSAPAVSGQAHGAAPGVLAFRWTLAAVVAVLGLALLAIGLNGALNGSAAKHGGRHGRPVAGEQRRASRAGRAHRRSESQSQPWASGREQGIRGRHVELVDRGCSRAANASEPQALPRLRSPRRSQCTEPCELAEPDSDGGAHTPRGLRPAQLSRVAPPRRHRTRAGEPAPRARHRPNARPARRAGAEHPAGSATARSRPGRAQAAGIGRRAQARRRAVSRTAQPNPSAERSEPTRPAAGSRRRPAGRKRRAPAPAASPADHRRTGRAGAVHSTSTRTGFRRRARGCRRRAPAPRTADSDAHRDRGLKAAAQRERDDLSDADRPVQAGDAGAGIHLPETT